MRVEQGLLRKGIGGFYYVEVADATYECKARGAFRKNKISPMAGDQVEIRIAEGESCSIESILPRKNFLVRPPVANLDQLFLVTSVCEPAPNPLILDKMIAVAENRDIEPIVVLSKMDLQDGGALGDIYRSAGISFLEISSTTGEGVERIRALTQNKISAFIGNSGVGKSSLLNCLNREFQQETGEISQKLGRGRHTTRQVELLKLKGGGYVADTPGFSTVDMERYDIVKKDDLQFCFREFAPYLGQCKFPSCSHTCEKGCAVLQAVEEGHVHPSRHQSYVTMYKEVKDIKEWQMKERNV